MPRGTSGPRDPDRPGDPTWHRFLTAVDAGAVPFCCQGPANGLTLDGGQTLGWELGLAVASAGDTLDHVVVQVGGGALASSTVRALDKLVSDGTISRMPRIHTVQTTGAAPLARALDRLRDLGLPSASAVTYAAHHRSAFMWPWEEAPHSVAHGILDDETYDWLRLVRAMGETGGEALVVQEETLMRARQMAHEVAGIEASHTGTAGLAGVMSLVESGTIGDDETVAVCMTGRERHR